MPRALTYKVTAKPSAGPAGLGPAAMRSTRAGSQDALDRGVGLIERVEQAGEADETLLAGVERDEQGPLAPDQIDVGGEAVGGLLGVQIEVQAGGFEFLRGCMGQASHLAVKTGERAAFKARRACIRAGWSSASGMRSRS